MCFALIMIAKPRTAESECECGRAQPLYQYLSGGGEIKRGVVKLRKYISETGYELVSMNKTKEDITGF